MATFEIETDEDLFQKRRSGVLTDFSITSINSNTQIQITADNSIGFTEIYFNNNTDITNDDGFIIDFVDQIVNVPVDIVAKRFFVSINSSGTVLSSETKTSSGDISRVHLFSYLAQNGTLAPQSLLENPYLAYVDKSLQGILEIDGVRVNNLEISSQDDSTLGIKSSSFDLVGNAINYEIDKVNVHTRPVPAIDPLNWTYQTQVLNIVPPIGTDVLLDPANFDVAGVITPVGGGSNTSTIQLVMITPVKEFIIFYGQETFSTYDDAILNARSVTYILPDIAKNAVEVARIVMKRTATDSADTSEVLIIDTTGGGAGGGLVETPTEFFDADFKLKNSTDTTKISSFEASKQATGTSKIHKLPSDNSELMTLNLSETITAEKQFRTDRFKLTKIGSETTRAEFVLSQNQSSGSINSYSFERIGGKLELERDQRKITGDRTLTEQDIILNSIYFVDNGTSTINVTFPDINFDLTKYITIIILGTGTVNIIPSGSTTFNNSGSTLTFTNKPFKVLDFYHEGETNKEWFVDEEDYRLFSDNSFDDSLLEIFDNVDNTKIGKFDASIIPNSTTRTYTLPSSNGTLALTSEITDSFNDAGFNIFDNLNNTRIAKFQASSIPNNTTNTYTLPSTSGTLALEANNKEDLFAFVKFNPRKTVNGEAQYRNQGTGLRVFREGIGRFVVENNGTVLNTLGSNWATRASNGSQAYISLSWMIAGVSGVGNNPVTTVSIETWSSANGNNTGQPGTVTIFIRDSGGNLTDVSNDNGNITLRYVEI